MTGAVHWSPARARESRAMPSFLDDSGVPIVNARCPLSKRELEALTLIAQGMRNKEAAVAMGVAEQTIKNFMLSIHRKFRSTDRTASVVIAIRMGWIDVDALVFEVAAA